PLTRKHQHHPAATSLTSYHVGRRLTRHHRRQPSQSLIPITSDHRHAVLEDGSVAAEGVGHIGQSQLRMFPQVRTQSPGHRAHRYRNASILVAHNSNGTTASPPDPGSAVGSGASSRITCAFVPLTPNADTAPRRGRPFGAHFRASVNSSTLPEDQSTSGV